MQPSLILPFLYDIIFKTRDDYCRDVRHRAMMAFTLKEMPSMHFRVLRAIIYFRALMRCHMLSSSHYARRSRDIARLLFDTHAPSRTGEG